MGAHIDSVMLIVFMHTQIIIGRGAQMVMFELYIVYLKAKSVRFVILLDLLCGAGVDMATPAPVQAAMDRFDTLLDELEALG
jgi:oligoendopeptidase F